MQHMTQNQEPQTAIPIRQSVTSTTEEMLTLLEEQPDPLWKRKFQNLLVNVEILGFRNGFMWGAIACAIACVALFLVTRP